MRKWHGTTLKSWFKGPRMWLSIRAWDLWTQGLILGPNGGEVNIYMLIIIISIYLSIHKKNFANKILPSKFQWEPFQNKDKSNSCYFESYTHLYFGSAKKKSVSQCLEFWVLKMPTHSYQETYTMRGKKRKYQGWVGSSTRTTKDIHARCRNNCFDAVPWIRNLMVMVQRCPGMGFNLALLPKNLGAWVWYEWWNHHSRILASQTWSWSADSCRSSGQEAFAFTVSKSVSWRQSRPECPYQQNLWI